MTGNINETARPTASGQAPELAMVIGLLTKQEHTEFWKFVAREARTLHRKSSEFSDLCIAIRARSDVQDKRSGVRVPPAARALSADELQREIARLKDKLLQRRVAVPFLERAFCHWIQLDRRVVLCAVLDALGCGHDGKGVRSEPIPLFLATEAKAAILSLLTQYGARDLSLACAGLLFNNRAWGELTLTYTLLVELHGSSGNQSIQSPILAEVNVSGNDTVARVAAASGITTTPDAVFFPSIPTTSVASEDSMLIVSPDYLGQSQAGGIESSGVLLKEVTKETGELKRDGSPDAWTPQQRARQAQARGMLGQQAQQVHTESRALSGYAAEVGTAIVSRCRSIVHRVDAAFGGYKQIGAWCDEAETALNGGEENLPSLEGAKALLTLIEQADHLDDDRAGVLHEKIHETFGGVVAAAALRGKLITAGILPIPQSAAGDLSLANQSDDVASEQNGAEAFVALGAVAVREDRTTFDSSVKVGAASREDWASDEATDVCARTAAELAGERSVTAARDDYQSFLEFESTHWIDNTGRVAFAPWSAPEFAGEMAERARYAWNYDEPALAAIFASAAIKAGSVKPLGVEDLACADRLLSQPTSSAAGLDVERIGRLRNYLTEPTSVLPDMGVALILEALRPTLPCTLTPEEIDRLIGHAAYNDPALDELARYLLNGWAAHLEPLVPLRTRLIGAPDEPIEALQAALVKAQSRLRAEVAALWSAAGGKIQHTHCRLAWREFVEDHVAVLRDELAPARPRGSTRGRCTHAQISERIVELSRTFTRIMDAASVRHYDRTSAQGAAEQIVRAISNVADAQQRLDRQQARANTTYDGCPYNEARRLLASPPTHRADRICALMFGAVLREQQAVNPLRLRAGYLIACPDLVRFLGPGLLSEVGVAVNGVRFQGMHQAMAAAVTLQHWANHQIPDVDSDLTLLAELRDAAANSGRRDILAALSSANVLQPHERTLLHRRALEMGGAVFNAIKELERIWAACNELDTPQELQLRAVTEDARDMAGSTGSGTSISANLMLQAWLAQCVETATRERDSALEARLAVARGGDSKIARQIEELFAAHDYRGGMALLHGGVVSAEAHSRRSYRRTMWRDAALEDFPEPRQALLAQFRGETAEQQQLVDAWIGADAAQRELLRRWFYAVVSGEAGRTTAENARRFPSGLQDLREHRERKSIVQCRAIREYFRRARLNPTFLPQLSDFKEIVLMHAPPRSPKSASVLDEWCKVAGDELAGTLVVFLAPGMPVVRRNELCAGLRARGVAAALIDDTDLLRLCAAGSNQTGNLIDGHDFIPFLELILEQQGLERASPFSSLDGQHVRIETYIGRAHEALQVATGRGYTRVFSGRKLGKSAFLKFVANAYDREKLPSGNVLNVFFITIAGGESERWVVDCIIEAMSERFGLAEESFEHQEPAERFSRYIKRFLIEKPDQSQGHRLIC